MSAACCRRRHEVATELVGSQFVTLLVVTVAFLLIEVQLSVQKASQNSMQHSHSSIAIVSVVTLTATMVKWSILEFLLFELHSSF